MRFLAHALSILLHPLLMPVITLGVAFRLDPHLSYFIEPRSQLIILLMVGVMTVVFPLMSIALLWRSELVSGPTLPLREERTAPYVMTLFYHAMAYYLLRRNELDPVTFSLMIGGMVALLATLLINLQWKISAHMVGIGGLLGALTSLLLQHGTIVPLELAPFILVAGALGTARLLVSDHTPAQIYVGGAVGFLSTFVCVMKQVIV
ncbi:MAG: hypothetical protein IT229_06830 [Flavobacteriales bacterium]|nr:hypothetical protein [Flavobacteriales bacterium]